MAGDLREAAEILKQHRLDFAKLVLGTNTETIVRLASLLDDFFELALKARMLRNGEKVNERDFKNDGKLATLHKKIKRAEELKLISKEAIADATAMRKIRNKLSHAKEWLHFESNKIDELAKGLSSYDPTKPNQDAILLAHSNVTDELKKVVKPDK